MAAAEVVRGRGGESPALMVSALLPVGSQCGGLCARSL